MVRRVTASMIVSGTLLAFLFVVPTGAQSPAQPTFRDELSQHHQAMYQLMKDMTDQMGQMTDQMSHGELAPEQRQQMVERMDRMSAMMRRMSGLEARPAMQPDEWQKQMGEMRGQMDSMMRDSRMMPGAK
jgi:hypothetical protein